MHQQQAFDQLQVILDHYKNPRGHGVLEDADARAEGQNPLCGDEVTISVKFGDDIEAIDDVKFEGRGCAISQAATSMLMEMVKGRPASEVAVLPKEAPRRGWHPADARATQVRDSRARRPLKVALHRAEEDTVAGGVVGARA